MQTDDYQGDNAHVDYTACYAGEGGEVAPPDPAPFDAVDALKEEFAAEGAQEITESNDEAPLADSPETYVLVNVAALNLRESDSMEADVIKVLSNGARLKVIDEKNPEWLFVEINGEVGYIKKSLTTPA